MEPVLRTAKSSQRGGEMFEHCEQTKPEMNKEIAEVQHNVFKHIILYLQTGKKS